MKLINESDDEEKDVKEHVNQEIVHHEYIPNDENLYETDSDISTANENMD